MKLINEQFYDMEEINNKLVELFVDPTSREMRSIKYEHGLRFGMTEDGQFYGWNADYMHYDIETKFNLSFKCRLVYDEKN